MTEDLIAMARIAGMEVHERKGEVRIGSAIITGCDCTEQVERFAALIEARAVARTREECAALCEKYARKTVESQSGSPDALTNIMLRQIAHLGFEQSAGAIRDGEKP